MVGTGSFAVWVVGQPGWWLLVCAQRASLCSLPPAVPVAPPPVCKHALSCHRSPLPQVLHVPDFDTNTHCILLADCLAELKRWSGAAPAARHAYTRLHAGSCLGLLWQQG